MFSLRSTLTRIVLKRISYKYKNGAFLSYCCCNNNRIFPKETKIDFSEQRMKLSNTVAGGSDSGFFHTYSEIFKTLSESTPVHYMQQSLIDIHNSTGLPWWATIVCSTILLRTTITLPLAVYQQVILSRLELIKYEMNDLVQELKTETTVAARMYDWDERTARSIYNHSLKSNWRKLIVRDNCHPFKTSILLLVQIPLWISMSMSLRNLIFMQPIKDVWAELTFNQLCSEGILWIQNLTEIDSTFILPIIFGLTNLSLIELSTMSKVTIPSKTSKILTNLFRGFAIIMIPVSASVPSALVLYWTTSSMFGLVQNITLMSPRVRRFCRIPLAPSELEHPYKQLVVALQSRITRRNKEGKENC